MHKNATKCNETIGKWCKNKHGASKIIDTFETYQYTTDFSEKLLERCCSKTDQDLWSNHGVQLVRDQYVQRPLEKSKGRDRKLKSIESSMKYVGSKLFPRFVVTVWSSTKE
jgi:hypothetical protein